MSREYKLSQEDKCVINSLLTKERTPDDILTTFSIKLADNVDTSNGIFSDSALSDIAKLAIGKKGYIQTLKSPHRECYIYKAEVREFESGKKPAKGDVAKEAIAYCCMIITEDDQEIIARLCDSENKRNMRVSSQFGVKYSSRECSCCGSAVGECFHQIGCTYNEKLCYTILNDIYDFYGFRVFLS